MWIGLIVVVIVIVILLAAVFGGLLGPPEEKTLKVGVVASITGRLQPFGPNNRNAVIMAAEEINAATGGVLGQPIQLFIQDDQTTPTIAHSAASTLVSQNHVDAIIGATGSNQCKQVLEVAKANSVFEVSGSCTSPEFSNLTYTGGWWARTAPSDSLQGAVAAYYAYHNMTKRRAGVIGTNDAYGRGLAQVFADKFAALGGTITTNSPRIVTPTPTTTDFTLDLTAVLDVTPAPEIVYLVGYPDDGVLMMKNFQAGIPTHSGWGNVFWLFSEGLFDQTGFIDKARNSPNNVNVTLFEGTAPAAFGGVYGPTYSAFESRYKARWNKNTTLFDDNYYDALALIALAAQAAGSATGAAIKSKIFDVANPPGVKIFPGMWKQAFENLSKGIDIDYEGASGAVNINNLGDPKSGYIVWGVNDTTYKWFRKEMFNETFVSTLAPAPPMPGTRGFVWEPIALTREETEA